jgi:UDP-4-amino-4,6-dideoxy-N-acetyl-beta-L-altrosamine transaminase
MRHFLPYGRQTISEDDISAVVDTLRSDYLTQGPAVDAFEKTLAQYVGCKHIVAVNSGTAALHLAYLALDLAPGDAVIVPAITFAATANAAVYCGATPIFADVDLETGLMTAQTCQEALERALSLKLRPRLVVPVHYAGLPVAMSEIIKVANSYDCMVFEDACHALGAEYRDSKESKWKKVGNWGAGSKGAAFSFHPVKHIATGEGGALATNCDDIAERARLLRTHGITKNSEFFIHKNMTECPWYYEMQSLGWNYRLCDVSAALGNSQLKRIQEFVEKRRIIASWYKEGLRESQIASCPAGDTNTEKHSWHLFPIRIDFPEGKLAKAAFMNQLKSLAIGTQVHYIPVPDLPFYQQRAENIGPVTCPNSQRFYDQELSVPMFPALTRDDIQFVTRSISSLPR